MYSHSLLNQVHSLKCRSEKHIVHIHSFLLLFLFGLLNILIFGGCQTSTSAAQHPNQIGPQTVDSKKFDLGEFFNKFGSLNKPDSSPKAYYRMGNEHIEFRIISDLPANAELQEGFEILEDLQGNKYLVSKKIELDHSDIAVIKIGIVSFEDTVRYLLSFDFKPECWDKVYDSSSRLINKRLGIVRKNKVLSAPIIQDAIYKSAMVSANFTESDIEWITSGFIKSEPPIPQEDRAGVIAWLENRLLKNPDDKYILDSLAREYANKKTNDCEKTFNIYKKVLFINQDYTPYIGELRKCYKVSQNYNDAINTYQKLLTHYKYDALNESIVRVFLAEAHNENGNKKEALKELHATLRLIESYSFPFPETFHDDKAQKSFDESITRYISNIKKMITMVENAQ